jgi:hypothetical protein
VNKRKPPSKTKRHTLSHREKVFVQLVARTGNVTQSYIDAGHDCTRASAATCGHRMLRNVEVREAVAEARKELLRLLEMDANEAMRRLSAVAGFDPADVFDLSSGNMLPLKDWPERARLAVTGWKDGEVKLGNKVEALRLIAEAGGRLKRKVELSGRVTLEDLISRSRRHETS